MIGHQDSIRNRKYSYWVSETDGNDKREPLLLIHGFGGTYYGLEELSDMLDDKFIVIGIDLPGYGQSEPLRQRHTLANYARFLDDFCRTTEYHELHVVGHSFGADIALVFASMFPDRVKKLVLVSPVVVSNRRLAKVTKFYYDIAARLPHRLRNVLLHGHFLTFVTDLAMFRQADSHTKSQILRNDYISDHLMSDRPVIESYRSMMTTNFLKRARKITAPTLIISGTKDKLSPPKDMQALSDVMLDAQTDIIAEAGHFVPIETPSKVGKRIINFIRKK